MIVDTELYEATSHGSGQLIACRCDRCGKEKKVLKFKLFRRNGYTKCRECFENGSQSRSMVAVECIDCKAPLKKRRDSIKVSTGRCASCAKKEVASRPEVKAVMSENGRRTPPKPPRGETHPNWRGGITSEIMKIRGSPAMRAWRLNVFARDDYTCQICEKRGGKLAADHIMPFALYPEARFATFNGRTLCQPCHSSYGAKVRNGKQIKAPVFPEDSWKVG